MASMKHIYDLDDLLTLYMLEQCELTHKQIWESLTRLTNGEIRYSANYITAILFRLRSNKLVQQYQESKTRIIYSVTEAGSEELRRRLMIFGIYDHILHTIANRDELPKIKLLEPVDFEESFDSFLERSEYDNAENMIFSLVRAAYKAGWCSAGGDPPNPQPILHLLPDKDHTDNAKRE